MNDIDNYEVCITPGYCGGVAYRVSTDGEPWHLWVSMADDIQRDVWAEHDEEGDGNWN